MASNFLITFGGTGARCAESVAYLLASRCIKQPVHVLIVDPDTANGNVKIARDQLGRYQTVQKEVRGNGSFFRTPLNEGLDSTSLFFQYPGAFTPFSTTIQFHEQQEEHRELLELLYDDSDMGLSFEKGYVGRAHIGSVDLFNVLKRSLRNAADEGEGAQRDQNTSLREFFKALRSAAQGPGARLMVVGSVFGGTGASGLPAIPPLLRDALGEELSGNVAIGCVQLAPYFTFPAGQARDPDSALHPLATQSALYHYAYSDTGYDRLYLLGAPSREATADENRPGGADQTNRAHYVELAAGLAVANFLEGVPDAELENPAVVACGADSLKWNTLPHGDVAEVRHNLVSFATFAMLHGHFLAEDLELRKHQGYSWSYQLERQSRKPLGGQERTLSDLTGFCRRFLDWAVEINETTSNEFFNLSKGKPSVAELARINSGGTVEESEAYHELMDGLNRIRRAEGATGAGWYVHAMTQAVDEFCERHYKGWW